MNVINHSHGISFQNVLLSSRKQKENKRKRVNEHANDLHHYPPTSRLPAEDIKHERESLTTSNVTTKIKVVCSMLYTRLLWFFCYAAILLLDNIQLSLSTLSLTGPGISMLVCFCDVSALAS